MQSTSESVNKRVVEYYLQGMSNRVMVTTPLTEAMESASLPRGGVQVNKEEDPEDRCCPREDNNSLIRHFNRDFSSAYNTWELVVQRLRRGMRSRDSVLDGNAPSG
jgi:hypothetical protein